MHFNFFCTISFTHLTTPSFCIKWKFSYIKTSNLGVIRSSKNLTNISKNTSIGRHIWMWGSTNWWLINNNSLINIFKSFYFLVFSNRKRRFIKIIEKCIRKNIHHQWRFSRSWNPRYHSHTFKRETHINIFKIIFLCSINRQKFFCRYFFRILANDLFFSW